MEGIPISPKEETQRLTEGLRRETLTFPTGRGGSHESEISSGEAAPRGAQGMETQPRDQRERK